MNGRRAIYYFRGETMGDGREIYVTVEDSTWVGVEVYDGESKVFVKISPAHAERVAQYLLDAAAEIMNQ